MIWQAKLCPACNSINSLRDLVCAQCVHPLHNENIVKLVRYAPPDENREGLVSASHGSTARRAAKRVTPRSGSQRYKVLLALRFGDRPTRGELALTTGLPPNSLRPRVKELLDDGYIKVSGEIEFAGQSYETLAITEKGCNVVG